MKNLKAVVKGLLNLDPDHVICVKEPWNGDSDATVLQFGEDGAMPIQSKKEGYKYFLEVYLEILEDFGDRINTDEEAVDLIIYYAENDAYPSWVFK